MEIRVVRKYFTENSTIGELSVNGKFECYTLEDVTRPVKVAGMTAIAPGHFELVVTFSARFKKLLPLLLNVPNFDGVRIHPGNTAHDTEGCLLVGQTKKKDFIGGSKAAFEALFAKILAASKKEKIFIEITEERTG